MTYQQRQFFSYVNTLFFTEKRAEAKYKSWHDEARLEQISWISALTGFMYLLYALTDLFIAPKEIYMLMVGVHAGLIAPFLFLISYLAKDVKYLHLVNVLLFVAPILAALANILMKIEPHTYNSELYLIIFWIFTVSGLSLWRASLSALIVFLMCVNAASTLPDRDFMMSVFWSISALSFGFLGAYILERSNRKVFMNEQRLKHLAETDKLTGLYNRTRLERALKDELVKAERSQHKFACVLIDIDYFKEVNDTYGHTVGDEILVEMSTLILKFTRKSDTVIRWGGEEFVLICTDLDKEGVIAVCEHLRQEISAFSFSRVGHLSVSIGIALSEDSDTTDSLIQKADKALYEAKNEGRNCTAVYEKI
jgi:diguanylate cyclase (GGDEF)-like protein